MKRRTDVKSRPEINQAIDKSGNDMQEKEADLDKIAADVETVRETLESLDFGGTSEGADAVEVTMEGAEDITEDVFDRGDEELEQIQEEDEEYQGELEEAADSDESDLEQISDASSRIETSETVEGLVQAKEAALRDIDFLSEQINRAREARDRSEQTQREYQNRVHTRGS